MGRDGLEVWVVLLMRWSGGGEGSFVVMWSCWEWAVVEEEGDLRLFGFSSMIRMRVVGVKNSGQGQRNLCEDGCHRSSPGSFGSFPTSSS